MNENSFKTNAELIKKAGFFEGFLKGAVENVKFKEQPFESIFSLFGTAIMWKISWKLGALTMLLQGLGYGPGKLGKIIDTYLKKGGAESVEEMNLKSGSELKSASDFAISSILGDSKKTSSLDYHLNDIYNIKKSISLNDIIAAAYVGKYFPIYKKGYKGRLGLFSRFMTEVKRGKRLGLSNILYGLLKLLVTGMFTLGIIGGVKEVIKEDFPSLRSKKTTKGPTRDTPSGTQYYANPLRNVEGMIIKILNTIKFNKGNFESRFQEKYGVSIENSPQMDKILTKIQMMNGGVPLSTINNWDAFFAPKLRILANMFMPGFIYEQRKNPKKELSKLLEGV
jgi:hypothetical protein